MKAIDRKLLAKLMKMAGSRLTGDWVLIGGTVLPLVGIDYRVTTDIDLVGTETKQQEQLLELMEMASELGLSVETINQAGAFFLHKIKDFKKHLCLVHEGPSARLFRPDLYLFIRLKIGRLSESDLTDCLEYAKYSFQTAEKVDSAGIKKLILVEIKEAKTEERLQRLKKLREAFADR